MLDALGLRPTTSDVLALGAKAFEGIPVAGALISPDRWLLWLGLLFVLAVYHFPTGIVGRLRAAAAPSKHRGDTR